MKIVKIEQNSEEWLGIRNNYLGASDANIILGDINTKITPLMLWNQKANGIEIDTSGAEFIFAKGHRLEDKMRNIMEMVLDHDLPALVLVSEDHDFLMASLDGYSEETGATWECKYVGQADFDLVASGKMMPNYYPQVQQQMMLAGAPFCYFTVVTEDKTKDKSDPFPFKYTFIEVPADPEYMKNILVPAMTNFWELVKTKTAPEAVHNDVMIMDKDKKMIDLLGNYYGAKVHLERTTEKCKKEMEEATKAEKDLKAAIFKLCKAKKVECLGVKLTQSKPSEKDVADSDAYIKKMLGLTDKKEIEKALVEQGFTKVKKTASKKTITFPKVKEEENL